jgi:2-phospho-L-lactate guanylyltransferase (CobY/MobA/RfbA family)
MNSKIIIGIPIYSFDNPMSRLSASVDLKTRQSLQKALLVNTVNCFKAENIDIYLISNSYDVEILAEELDVKLFKASVSGLNEEIIEFTTLIKNYKNWSICHADLPYLNKFNISVFLSEIENNKIVISKSDDNGTPLIGGSMFFDNFQYGKNSFIKHTSILKEQKIEFKQIFNKELYFELDTPLDYEIFSKNTPRWYKKLTL